MAYINPKLLGSAGARPPIKRKNALVSAMRERGIGNRLPGPGTPRRFPKDIGDIISRGSQLPFPGAGGSPIGTMPVLPPGISRKIGEPGRFNMSGDIMQMGAPAGPPSGYGARGEGWQAQMAAGGPDPYDEGMLGPQDMPPDVAQRPPWEGRMPQGGPQGINPRLMELIRMMMMGRMGGGGGFGGGMAPPPGGSYF